MSTAPPKRSTARRATADRPPRRYKKKGPLTWAAVRVDYQGGYTARECAARYGVTAHAVYWRAGRHGWRKCDVEHPRAETTLAAPSEPPTQEPDLEEDAGLGAAADLLRLAVAGALGATRAGRVNEAQAYGRLAATARRLAPAEAASEADDVWSCPSDFLPDGSLKPEVKAELTAKMDRITKAYGTV